MKVSEFKMKAVYPTTHPGFTYTSCSTITLWCYIFCSTLALFFHTLQVSPQHPFLTPEGSCF